MTPFGLRRSLQFGQKLSLHSLYKYERLSLDKLAHYRPSDMRPEVTTPRNASIAPPNPRGDPN